MLPERFGQFDFWLAMCPNSDRASTRRLKVAAAAAGHESGRSGHIARHTRFQRPRVPIRNCLNSLRWATNKASFWKNSLCSISSTWVALRPLYPELNPRGDEINGSQQHIPIRRHIRHRIPQLFALDPGQLRSHCQPALATDLQQGA